MTRNFLPNYARMVLLTLLIVAMGASIVGCSFKIPRVHKVTVQQGNVLTQEMIDRLKPGMTRSQVAFVMGKPVMINPFNSKRWDYIYSVEIPGLYEEEKRVTLFFEDDLLAYFTGDMVPTAIEDTEEVTTPDAAPETPEASSDADDTAASDQSAPETGSGTVTGPGTSGTSPEPRRSHG